MIHKIKLFKSIHCVCFRRVHIKFLHNSKFDLTAKSLVTNSVVITRVLCTIEHYHTNFSTTTCVSISNFISVAKSQNFEKKEMDRSPQATSSSLRVTVPDFFLKLLTSETRRRRINSRAQAPPTKPLQPLCLEKRHRQEDKRGA